MADRPILFSGAMVRAILDGKKTQTRRAITPRNDAARLLFFNDWTDIYILDPGNDDWRQAAHGFAVGDRLWVREAWRFGAVKDPLPPSRVKPDAFVAYEADAPHELENLHGRLRPSIHMPRWASRITLIVTDVRVQRVQDISREDAKAEGMPVDHNWNYYEPPPPEVDGWQGYEYASFSLCWNELNAKRGYGWDANPWVAAISFRPIFANIDHVEGDPTFAAKGGLAL